MLTTRYNPDVLSCLASLSSDEVFTPPALVNQMLDLLPKELWRDKTATFLDPACKSGVFLREITKRLMLGLQKQIPDRQQRVNHILTRQVFGIAITELTALLARRTLYCSKTANGKYSICTGFTDSSGNIHFNTVNHTWHDGRCTYCGAGADEYDRGGGLESHAYEFIHTQKPEKIFNTMKFDVIIGNPPYQMNDGGGTGSSATPIYNLFVEQAIKLNPRFLVMIIPARWYSGGKGLDLFRNKMLNDKRLRQLTDFADSRICFPGVDIAGGVCYFLWIRDNEGLCRVVNNNNNQPSISTRDISEFDAFIRDNIAVDIIRKVKLNNASSFESLVSTRKPFGLESRVRPKGKGDLLLYWSGGVGAYPRSDVTAGLHLIDSWKVLLSKASFDHGGQPDKEGKRRIFSRIEAIPPGSVCTESYLIVGPFETKDEAENIVNFLKLKITRFLVSTILLTQNITKDKFRFVPLLDSRKIYKDKELYKRFNLDDQEQAYIESMIRPMDLEHEE